MSDKDEEMKKIAQSLQNLGCGLVFIGFSTTLGAALAIILLNACVKGCG